MPIYFRFTKKRLDRLSEFFSNLSLVFVGTMIIPPFINAEKINLQTLVLGIVLTSSSLITSLNILK